MKYSKLSNKFIFFVPSEQKYLNMNIIEIENMEFFGYHGCYHEEQIVGNRFTVYLRLETSSMKAAETDRIEDALNYHQAYNILKKEMSTPSHLLEHVATRILNSLFAELNLLEKATVKVSKLNPPMGGKMDRVSVTLSRSL